MKKKGTYIISTDKSGAQGLYLNESSFMMHPGSIDLTKTIIKEKETPIKAGINPGIIMSLYDKYDNELYYNEYANKFTVTFIDQNQKNHNAKGEYYGNSNLLYYISETPVTIVGNTKVEIKYNDLDGIPIDASNNTISVIPNAPYPENSLLLFETSEGAFTKYKKGDSFEIKTNILLSLNVTLYDEYNNQITEITADSEIIDPVMSGNYMEPITFTVNKNTEYFNLDFEDNPGYIHIYQHLVEGLTILLIK